MGLAAVKTNETDLDDEDTLIANNEAPEGEWSYYKNRFWLPTETCKGLPSGVYKVGSSQRIGVYLDRIEVVADELVLLPGMGADVVLDEIDMFMAKRAAYQKRGVVHKRGILMEGPPGSGKTSNAELLIRRFVKERNGIAFLAQDVGTIYAGLQLIRKQEAERPIMIVIEDIDAVVKGGGEEHLLQLLDGRHQQDGVVVVATTNHLDKLPDRLANRPSRFDLVIKIALPNIDARTVYIKHREPDMAQDRVDEIASLTGDFTVAHLKELLLLTEIYEMPLTNALDRIKKIMERKLLPEQASIKVQNTNGFAVNE